MLRWIVLLALVVAVPARAQSDRVDLARDIAATPHLADWTIDLAGYGGTDDASHSLDAVRDTLAMVLAGSSADTLARMIAFLDSDTSMSFRRIEASYETLSPQERAELANRAEGLLERSPPSRADLARRMSAALDLRTLDPVTVVERLLVALERDEPVTYERVVDAGADQYALEQAGAGLRRMLPSPTT